MVIRAALCLSNLALPSAASAQREVHAAAANPFDAVTASQVRSSADRLGTASSTRDLLPPADRAQAERVMRSFAQCVVRGQGGKARALLASVPGSAAERAILSGFAARRNGCLQSGSLRMKGDWMRGAIAEQYYLRSYPDAVTEAARPDAPADSSAGRPPYLAYASCVAARDPAGADAVLRAEAGSVAEKSAYRQVMPALSSCLAGGENARLAIDRTRLRGLLAEALYDRRAGTAG